jgi:hypothetical protein
MTKALRNFPPEQRTKIAQERSKNPVKGLGTLAALDYLEKTKRVSRPQS